MPSGSCRSRRHGAFQRRMVMAVMATALVIMSAMETHASAMTTSRSDVVSSVRADSNVLDDSEDASASSSTKSSIRSSQSNNGDADGEARSLNFENVLTNAWDLLTTRTLRPKTSTTASEADEENTVTSNATEKPSSSVIKAESLSLSADDAVTEALKTATPVVTPSPVPTTVAPTPVPVVTVTPVVTPTPVETSAPAAVVAPPPTATPVAAATPVTAPVQQLRTPTPTPSPSPSASDTASGSSSSSKGSLDTDELVTKVNIKSGSSTSNFDTTIVVMIMGGVGVIGVVVLVMSRKISKETGDDEAIRRASSFGHVHL